MREGWRRTGAGGERYNTKNRREGVLREAQEDMCETDEERVEGGGRRRAMGNRCKAALCRVMCKT